MLPTSFIIVGNYHDITTPKLLVIFGSPVAGAAHVTETGSKDNSLANRQKTKRIGARMSIFKRGRVYWFHFYFNGKHVQRSTKSRNQRTAETVERAYRTQLEKGEVGIEPPKEVPTLKVALEAFLEWSRTEHAAHPNTTKRYATANPCCDILAMSDSIQLIAKR